MSTNKGKRSFASELILNNPVFGLYLGICSALAITTSINNAIGMGIAVIVVLTLSNIIISLIAPLTPDEIHIPVYIVVIATLVTLVGMLMQAFTPQLYSALGAFIDLIVVNCIILGRAEAFAQNNSVGASARDGLMMGLSYTLSILAMSFIRELLGKGTVSFTNPLTNVELFNFQMIPEQFTIPVFTTQTGAFLTFSVLAAFVAWYKYSTEEKEQVLEKETTELKKPEKEAQHA